MTERLSHRPIAYITGTKEFYGLNFRVTEGVLIPRPDTETAVEAVLEYSDRYAGQISILDLCCGSGCIGISVQLQCPQIRCTMTDLSPKALAVTRENAERLQAACEILSGDLFEAAAGRTFDLILSNPPYIPGAECDALQAEVIREPRMALDGGADGLDFYRRIAAEAPGHLKPGGCLMLEIGYGEREAVETLLKQGGAVSVRTEKDFSGIPRMTVSTYP